MLELAAGSISGEGGDVVGDLPFTQMRNHLRRHLGDDLVEVSVVGHRAPFEHPCWRFPPGGGAAPERSPLL